MDERQLKEILGAEAVPPADENARKQAINLALAAFDEAQRETRTKRQGFGLLRRLIGRDAKRSKGRPMRKSLVYGGSAAALLMALTTVVTVQVILPSQDRYLFPPTAYEAAPTSSQPQSQSQGGSPGHS